MRNGIPTLAVVGPGRAGKDTVAEWLRDHTVPRFHGGCSWTGRHYVAERLGLPVDEAWQRRHEMRMSWYTLLNEYRQEDSARLIKDVMGHSDVVAGVRDGQEIWSGIYQGLFDLVLWLDRDVPHDPTLTFGPEVADVVLPNRGSLDELYIRLQRLARVMQILLPSR